MTVTAANQKIIRIRREYNTWVADETLEDYALRYTPHSFRKWSEWRVANTAMGGVSFLALEAIGAVMALNYGFTNTLWAILAVAASLRHSRWSDAQEDGLVVRPARPTCRSIVIC